MGTGNEESWRPLSTALLDPPHLRLDDAVGWRASDVGGKTNGAQATGR